ncbi:MAG: leucine-rich repeat domain-containing protein [Actinomycetes bacterium]
MKISEFKLKKFYAVLITTTFLVSFNTTPAQAVSNGPVNCGTSGTFTVTSNVVTTNTTCVGSVDIPVGVTSIGTGAFWTNTAITSVTIPNTVTYIGNSAFNSTTLTAIEIPDSVVFIDDYAFNGSPLASVTIPNYVTGIGVSAFQGTALASVTIGSSVDSIGANAFKNVLPLTSVTIPASVTFIGSSAFEGSTSLVSVTFSGNAPATVSANAFTNIAANAIAYVSTNATGFGSTFNGLNVNYASAPTSSTSPTSSSPETVSTPAIVPNWSAVITLKNRKYLSKNTLRDLTKAESSKRNSRDKFTYSILKSSKKTCVMRGNYVMALKKTGACEMRVTRATTKGTKYKYLIKINYTK